MAISGRQVALAITLVLSAALGCSSCSAPPARPAAQAADSVCFRSAPPAWAAEASARGTHLPGGTQFGPMAVSGNAAYGMISAGGSAGVGEFDLTNGSLRKIAALPPGSGGLGGAAASGPWLVWQQFDSQTTTAVWSVHSWNQATGETVLIATSALPEGTTWRDRHRCPWSGTAWLPGLNP